MEIESVIKSWCRYSFTYDFTWGVFLSPGRKHVIKNMNCNAENHVLEVGVGTGASLPLYSKSTKVTGVDLSAGMLKKARKRIEKYSLTNAEILMMNAEDLSFPDNHFSHVVAMYVVSVSPNPEKVVAELKRVCKPGGEIIILNHFSRADSWMTRLEKLIAPLSGMVGFLPFFPLEDFMKNLDDIEVHHIERTNLLGYWTILWGRNLKSAVDVV